MELNLQYAGMTGAENLEFVNYYYDENSVGVKEEKKGRVKSPEPYEDFMHYGDSISAFGMNKKMYMKRLFNFVNKHNPVTMNLRNGILASLMLNKDNSSESLRWSYITPNEARLKGMDIDKWIKLVEFRQKLEDIFYKAGGLKESMKIAIVEGMGNKDNSVYGWDGYRHPDNHRVISVDKMNENSSLAELLGLKLFQSENSSKELTETDTATCIETARGFIHAISKQSARIGDIFKGKSENSNVGNNSKLDGFVDFFTHIFGTDAKYTMNNYLKKNDLGKAKVNNTAKNDLSEKHIPASKADKDSQIEDNPAETQTGIMAKAKSFYNQHKKVVVGTAIGLIGLALFGLSIHAHLAEKKAHEVITEHHKTNRKQKSNGGDKLFTKSEQLESLEMS